MRRYSCKIKSARILVRSLLGVPAANLLNFQKINTLAFDRLEKGRVIADEFRTIERRAPRDLLKRFCAIADAEDTEKSIVRFVRAWGLLLLCDEHSLPVGHNSPGKCVGGRDSVQAYLDFALCLQTLRDVGLALSRADRPGKHLLHEIGRDGDWDMAARILCAPPLDGAHSVGFGIGIAGAILVRFEELMEHLITACNIYPALTRRENSWNVGLATSPIRNLPAIIAMQLILEIAGAKAQRKCAADECPRWFIPRRRQIYCDACGIRAAWRASYRRKRDKLRSSYQ